MSHKSNLLNTDNLDLGTRHYSVDQDDFAGIGPRYGQSKKPAFTIPRITMYFMGSVVLILAVLIGLLIGHLASSSNNSSPLPKYSAYNTDIRTAVFNSIKPKNIEKNLKELTSMPHLAGQKREEEYLANYVKNKWLIYLDKVEVFPYDVLLSYPNKTDLNYLSLVYSNGTKSMKTNAYEKPLTELEKNPEVKPIFNGYAPKGHVVGNMFYVNYGRIEDFELLQKMSINVSGSICIVKYGKIFRGDKAKLAQQFHCAGLVMYTDPHDYAGVGIHEYVEGTGDYYPKSWWLPPTGVQRGTLWLSDGDPLTPNYPAINGTYREPKSEDIPKIPVQPISYSEAKGYLEMLDGETAPESWQGGFNFSYKIGGSFVNSCQDCKAELHVANYVESKTIKTIIGYIKGWQEPDRYVLLGNHRDAWDFGGADPSSGTAVMLEMSRAITGVMKQNNWRPRRSILFCSWGAEEYGLIGSSEWTEQMEKILISRAITYLNIDIAVQGRDTFRASSTPMLYDLLYNTTKNLPNPNPDEIKKGRESVFDTWVYKNHDDVNPKLPFITNLGSGSDYTMFVQKAGVPSIDFRYTFDHSYGISSYPVYHSVHDTFEYFSKFLDPDFEYSRAVAGIAADLVLQLSSLQVLPLNPESYGHKLELMANELIKSHGNDLLSNDVNLAQLNDRIRLFKENAQKLKLEMLSINSSSSELYVRSVNDRLVSINKGFLDFNGIPNKRQFRHVIFAPSSLNWYSGAGFPAVYDAIYEAKRGGSWDFVRKQFSILCLQIYAAANLMIEF